MEPTIARTPFDVLQRRLRALGSGGIADLATGTIVVLPSISFPTTELRKIVGIERYEERLLCLTLFLEHPEVDMVYATSAPISEVVVDYYLSFLPDPKGARARLTLVDIDDEEPRALTEKLLGAPDALDRVRGAIVDPQKAYILPFNVTPLEREIAEILGVPLFGPLPELVAWGSKSGGRQLARDAGVPVLPGSEDLYSLRDVERALQRLRSQRPSAEQIVIKLNNGFSGQGNAIVDLATLRPRLDRSPTTFCAAEESWPSFLGKIEADGAILEEVVRDPAMVSPSVQVRIAPNGSYEIVSTHDQILGGPDNQVYLGCRFPARPEYRDAIVAHARSIAEELSERDVIGSFGMDFIVVPIDGSHDIFLSEINLRLGGTTHPFLMAKGVTNGMYDEKRGELLVHGRPTTYIATDNLKSEAYKQMSPADAIATLTDAGLDFDPSRGAGAVLHLLGALERYGKLGVLCISHGREAADDLYAAVVAALDERAARLS
ncbi:MAG: peptide ligase PGM1-related protein [Actinomycetota bacterium]|nr:peptide ligase PGM1-related protein [Actinomycetota bacterium]